MATDGNSYLICTQEDVGTNGMWTVGAVVDASLPATVSNGVRYLRWDFSYDLSNTNDLNDSGGVVGFIFHDDSGDNVAGVMLKKDAGANSAPAYTVTEVTELPDAGTVSVVAKVDLSTQMMGVWYDLTGDVSGFSESSPTTNVAVSITAFDSLRFHATGDLQPAGSSDNVKADLLRMADTWGAIVAEEGISPVELQLAVSASSGMEIGDSNRVSVVISNQGGAATGVSSVLTHDGAPSSLTVISNNAPAALAYGASVTNTYDLIANLGGEYLLTAQAFSVETNSSVANFELIVGSQVTYLTNSVAEVSGGLFSGKYEPGETLEIAVSSVNDGGRDLTNVVNTLSSDSTYFTAPIPGSVTYSALAVGAVTSTTYQVTIHSNTPAGTYTFVVTNRASGKIWADSFSLTVYSEAIPVVSPASVILRATEGQSDTGAITVKNDGNKSFGFSITDDGSWGSSYVQSLGDDGYASTPYVLTLNGTYPETSGQSDVIDFGFGFPFYGTTYSGFYVTSDGVIGLSNSTNTLFLGDGYGTLPAGNGAPLIAPFWGSLRSAEGGVRYNADQERVVISFTGVSDASASYGGIDQEFQALLYADGRIEFRYKEINSDRLDRITIGIQGSSLDYKNLSFTPASDTSVRVTPLPNPPWVTYSPQEATVAPMSTQTVAFTLNAGQPLGSQSSFTAHINFIGVSGGEDVSVDAEVVSAAPEYWAASSLSFTGGAGQVTSVPFVITNVGTGTLEFGITDPNAMVTRFAVTNSGYDWINISSTGTDIELNDPSLNPFVTARDEGVSDPLPVGFDFPFVGNSYNQFSVSANGALLFDATGRVYATHSMGDSRLPDHVIMPYGGDLVIDENASLKYHSTEDWLIVTWENVKQYGLNGGSNLTFQIILEPNGKITCQYKVLEGYQWPKTLVAGWRDVVGESARFGAESIIQPGDWTTITNSTFDYVYTQYVDSVSERIFTLEPYETRIIRYTPTQGTIPPDGTAEITITGDASGQSQGSNDASTNVTLTITHNASGSPDSLVVTFTATNSQETGFVPFVALADSDGDGLVDDAERIAGSDPQDASSVFTPIVKRSPAGTVLSWEEPLDGLQRTYKVYWTRNLMGSWDYLDTVTNATSYVDMANINEPVIYYKMTVE